MGGCGLTVPELQEPPANTMQSENDALVQAIVHSVHCEIEDAVTAAINDDIATQGHNGFFYANFLSKWGAEVALTLTVEEKSIVSPNAVFMPPNPATALFTLGGGLSQSADATRIDKMNYYYTVKELYLGRDKKCIRDEQPVSGSLLVQSDLKLREWLEAQVTAVATRQLKIAGNSAGPWKQNVLSHEVRFDVVSSGNISPAWKLVRATVNQSGSFLTASRDRTHDLLITFGPLDNSQSRSFLAPIAENSHFISQITSGVSTGVRNGIN